MTSVWSRGRLRQECLSVTLSVVPSVAPLDSSPPLESSDKLSEQPARVSRTKSPVVDAPVTAINISKYSKNDLQRIFKTILEAQAPASTLVPAPTPAPAPVVFELPWEKLQAFSPSKYCGKSHMDYYNFCQQCEDYFATAGAMGPTQISFAVSFL